MLELSMTESVLLKKIITEGVKQRKIVTQNTGLRVKYLEKMLEAEEEISELLGIGERLNVWIADLKELEEMESKF